MEKKIIFFIIILFVVSSAILFYVSGKYRNPDYQKDWWAVYFENPKDGGLDFILENHGQNGNFHWEISAGEKKIFRGEINIQKGKKEKISPDWPDGPDDKKITVKISPETGESKEIYKNR